MTDMSVHLLEELSVLLLNVRGVLTCLRRAPHLLSWRENLLAAYVCETHWKIPIQRAVQPNNVAAGRDVRHNQTWRYRFYNFYKEPRCRNEVLKYVRKKRNFIFLFIPGILIQRLYGV